MRYTVTGLSAAINSGVIELTEAQAQPRLHNLKALGGGKFEVLRPVEFKRGETFGYADRLPKSMAEIIEPEAKVAAKAKAAAKAVAEAKAEGELAPKAGDEGGQG